jgi:Methylase involved in ubiquinone/menaquinone biosynthesis
MDRIQKSYQKFSDTYDAFLMQKTWQSQVFYELFFNNIGEKQIAPKVLKYIPDDFSGFLLDVPVGTAVFTEEKYKKINHAKICVVDSSDKMMEKTRQRLGQCGNIKILEGDVSKMGFSNNTFNIVLSMNGFHSFASKDQAYSETYRVLKTGGKFIACMYIKGKCKTTDMIIKHLLARKGWFTPPFETEESLKERLEKMYRIEDFHVEGSFAYFSAVKK